MNEVQAVTKAQVAMVEHLLRKHGGDLYADIWRFGVNTALRVGDLLAIRMDAAIARDVLTLTEQKTGKPREVTLNSVAKAIIARRFAEHPNDTWLFQAKSNRAKSAGQPIRRETVARKFAEVGEMMGISLATHSMRKSRGAILYRDGVPIETVCKVLNHASPAVTLRYIGLDRATVAKTYLDYEI